MKIKQGLIALFILVFSTITFAQDSGQDPAPVAMLKQTSNQMLSALAQNKANLKNNEPLIYKLVTTIVLPHIDLESMSRSVVGRTYWSQATQAQRDQFENLFTHQVIQTYSSAIASYDNEQINFLPMRGGIAGDRVEVESVIVRKNGQNIPMSYRLINNGGNWQVYDFSVENVSLVQSYQSQFSNDLQQGGLAGLISKMQQRYGQQ